MPAPGPHAIRFRRFAPDDLPALQRIRAAAFAPIFQLFRESVGLEIAGVHLYRRL